MILTNLPDKKYLIILPAIAAFCIALIPTLKYQWPLGWDITYHVQYAQVYAHYGFTLTDPQLNAPYGSKIAYPPLFHFLIAGLGTLFSADFFQVARFLQPVLAMSIVLSVSYVAYKFYGTLSGVSAGFIMLSSYLITRIVLPLPENLALIFIPLAVYLYYRSLKNHDWKSALLCGILFIAVTLTHQAAPLCLILVITSITLLELVVYRNLSVFKNFISFLLPILTIGIVGVVFLAIFNHDVLQNLFQQGISGVTGMSTSLSFNRPLGLYSYLGHLGILALLFSFIGIISVIKDHRKKDLVVIVWIISMILLSNAYLFGINVISYRVLIYLLLPLSILAGYGVSFSYEKLKNQESSILKKLSTVFLIVIFSLSIFSAISTVEDPKIAIFGVKNEMGYLETAPPSESEIDLVNWFNTNGDKNHYVVISNQFVGMFLAANTNMTFHEGFEYFSTNENVTIEKDSIKSSPLSIFKKDNIGYIIYDKRLITPNSEKYAWNNITLLSVNSEFFPLNYFTQDIHENINQIKPEFAQIVYENHDFIVCKVNY